MSINILHLLSLLFDFNSSTFSFDFVPILIYLCYTLTSQNELKLILSLIYSYHLDEIKCLVKFIWIVYSVEMTWSLFLLGAIFIVGRIITNNYMYTRIHFNTRYLCVFISRVTFDIIKVEFCDLFVTQKYYNKLLLLAFAA